MGRSLRIGRRRDVHLRRVMHPPSTHGVRDVNVKR